MKRKISLFVAIASLLITGCNQNKEEPKELCNEISQNDWNSYRQYVDLSTGIRMSYVEMGNPNGEPIVLQHGMTDNSRSWSLAAPYFAKAGYHVYMPDLRGQGYSQEADGHYTALTYAADLNAFFEAKHIESAICVGHSLGSYTMQSFWLQFPERVKKVVLVSSIPQFGYQAEGLHNLYNSKIKPLAEDGHLDDSFLENYWYNCDGEPVESEIVDNGEHAIFLKFMAEEAKRLSKKTWTNIIMGMLETNFCGDDKNISQYSFFDKTKQCLILHGETDTMTTTTYQGELVEVLSNEQKTNVTYREYQGVGHNIQFVTPKRCATDILGWLSSGVLPPLN